MTGIMFFPTSANEQSLWLAYLLIAVFCILLFVFRETLFQWKEKCKADIRKILHDRIIQVSVVGDTAKTSTGFLTVLFDFLDEHFLKPSADTSIYDYDDEDEGGEEEEGDEEEEEDEGEEGEEEEDEGEEKEEVEEGLKEEEGLQTNKISLEKV